ncbi:hypothetical protein [Shewanella woodyi]|uniref:hypothetical protein n=1 Tax=Shewanella woodyi TaxID=60961 RepID=UPI0037494E60
MDIEQIIIVALIFAFPWLSYDYFKYKTKMKQLEAKLQDSEKVKVIDELDSVKHRLVVLEKLITDKGYEVNEEIRKL